MNRSKKKHRRSGVFVKSYIGFIDIDDGIIAFVDGLDDGLYVGAELLFALVKAEGDHEVEEHVGMRGTLDHAEIVQSQTGIHAADECDDLFLDLQRMLVIGGDGVHVDDGITAELLTQILLDVVDHIVRFDEVGIGGDLCVQRDHHASGTVVVDDEIVNTCYALVRVDDIGDLVNERLFGGRAEQRIHRFLGGANARDQNEDRYENTAIRVDVDVCEMRDQKTRKNHARRYAVGKAVVRGGSHGGGADLFADSEIIVCDVGLDEYGANQNDERHRIEYGLFGRNDLFHGGFAELEADEDDDHGNDESRDVLDSAVSEGVVLVGLLLRHTEADERDDGGACVGQIVEGIRHDGDRTAEQTCKKFNAEKDEVQNNSQRTAQRAVGVSDLGRSGVFMIGNEKLC